MSNTTINSILNGIDGIPSLPLFIGNYLLDLVSEFFPIFILLSSFVIVYIGFTRGSGDWKQTLQSIAPQITSIIVIMALLSMKSPYKNSSGNGYFENTNSYVIVEMINTFLNFGSFFGDALTHKIIYGNLDVSENKNSQFNGYFPNFLQSLIDQNVKKNEVQKDLIKNDQIVEIENKISSLELFVYSSLKKLMINLKKDKIIENPHDIISKNEINSFFKFDVENEKILFGSGENLKEYDYEKIGNFESDPVLFEDKIEKEEKYIRSDLNYELDFFYIIRNFVNLKITQYNLYNDYIKNYEEKLKTLTREQSSNFLTQKINEFKQKNEVVKKELLTSLYLDKDYQKILKLYNREFEFGLNNEVDTIFNTSNFYKNLKENTIISEKIENEIKLKLENMKKRQVPIYSLYNNESEYHNSLISIFNQSFLEKSFIIHEFYYPLYNLLKGESIDRMGIMSNSRSIFNLVFLDQENLEKLDEKDKKMLEISKKYLDKISGEVSVAKVLNEEILKQNKDIDKKIISWTDLGKFYSTFKNSFSPILTGSIVFQDLQNVKNERNEELIKFMQEQEPLEKNNRLINAGIIYGSGQIVKNVVAQKFMIQTPKETINGIWDSIKTLVGIPLILFFVNVLLPAFIWLFVIITYFLEMSIYVAIVPISFIFMVFQSYRQGLMNYINMLLGFILLPIILVTMYFVVLYIDMLIPLFMHELMPYFGSFDQFTNAFLSGNDGILNKGIGIVGGGIMEILGTTIYTIINLVLSSLLLLTFFRTNEYLSKVLSVSTIGMDTFQGRETLNKFASFSPNSFSKV
ncbi:hypothetical protein [Aliarcobacter butzleri]|uniref:hypothetical protein n=1 Tax=Aliarcobacter butzleri TaxID=28197 RepID=UPI00263D444F|nr:hypothetical protein [Aliarcobacter butzleri]MDN5082011.1 hypothetical protein [Aliarcobacter butzleri]MDN5084321.1 hypothetical protein [Aliarcobacter butzleri]